MTTDLIQITLPDGLGSWQGSLGQALGVLAAPAAGLYAFRLHAALAALPAVKAAHAAANELVAECTQAGESLLALAWWSDPTHDAGWSLRARSTAAAMLAECKAKTRNAPRMIELRTACDKCRAQTGANGAKRATSMWRKANDLAVAKGMQLTDEHREAVRELAWSSLAAKWRKAMQQITATELDLATDDDGKWVGKPWAPLTAGPSGPVRLAVLAAEPALPGFTCPDPIHAERAAARARRLRKGKHLRRKARAERAAARRSRALCVSYGTTLRVEAEMADYRMRQARRAEAAAAACRCKRPGLDVVAYAEWRRQADDAHVARYLAWLAADDAAHVVARRCYLDELRVEAARPQGTVRWVDSGLLRDGVPVADTPACSCCNMRLPLRLVEQYELDSVVCPHCGARLR